MKECPCVKYPFVLHRKQIYLRASKERFRNMKITYIETIFHWIVVLDTSDDELFKDS